MGLTRFVSNVDDLSDSGGYKFRFKCDLCQNGVESHYESSSSNILKTGLEVFSLFSPLLEFGFEMASDSKIANRVDRGLRGKERDRAYERAVHEAMALFKSCQGCNKWVCPESCWNPEFGLCEGCAPNTHEVLAKEAAARAHQEAMARAAATSPPPRRCPLCSQPADSGKYCSHCGTPLVSSRACRKCQQPMGLTDRFCAECGYQAAAAVGKNGLIT